MSTSNNINRNAKARVAQSFRFSLDIFPFRWFRIIIFADCKVSSVIRIENTFACWRVFISQICVFIVSCFDKQNADCEQDFCFLLRILFFSLLCSFVKIIDLNVIPASSGKLRCGPSCCSGLQFSVGNHRRIKIKWAHEKIRPFLHPLEKHSRKKNYYFRLNWIRFTVEMLRFVIKIIGIL